MSRLKELIGQLCPDGVEYRPVKHVATIRNGKDHKLLQDGDIPVYGSGGIMRYVDTASYDKPSVLLPRKGSLSNVFYVDQPFWNVDTIFHTIINEERALPKYFYYAMCNARVEQYGTEGARPSLTQSVLNDVKIPVPPIEVQREIVRILDSFQELDDALTAEIEAREKQLVVYMMACLSKHDVKDFVALGDICSIKTGKKPEVIKEYSEGLIPYINAGLEPSGWVDGTNAKGDCITIPSRGVGGAGIPDYQAVDFWCGPLCYQVRSKSEKYDNRFIYFYLKSIEDELLRLRNTGGMAAVNKKELVAVRIPVLPVCQQTFIADSLMSIQMLCRDGISGIPAERDARRKQFAYYRDKLLDLPEKVTTNG